MTIVNPLPYTLTNGTTADATQVMADLNQIVANVNANGAENGANSSITSLTGLTTPLPINEGGTGTITGGNLVPSASMTMWAGNPSSPPDGWLYCDGSAVSRATYATLFATIGTAFGSGDGSTTFNIPDMRGRVAAGYDSGNATGRLTDSESGGCDASAMGNSGGEQAHVLITAELASHDHALTDPGHNHSHSDPGHSHGITDPTHEHTTPGGNANVYGSGGIGTDAYPPAGPTATSAAATGISVNNATTGITNVSNTTGITIADAGSGQAHNNVQPTLIIGFIIKT